MDYTIARRLKGLLRRLRLFHMLWSLALVWVLFALLGFWLWNNGRQGDGVPAVLAQAWLIGGLATTLLCVGLAWRSFKNLNGVARIVESRYPQLNQRLITAAELRPLRADGDFTFLQRSVINEALNHDVKNQWLSIVPTKRLIALALANIPGLLAVCGVGWALWRSPKVSVNPPIAVASAPSQILPPEVVPGNTEVKKGSSLIVTAKFPGKVPSQVWLVRQSIADAKEQSAASESNLTTNIATEDKLLMKRSLGDPLFAAYMNDIREPLEYRIEYESDASPKYSVGVFECPEVVRVDAQMSYPLYTQLEAKEIIDTRRVSAPIGSTLSWLIHMTKPVVRGALIPKADGQPLELKQDNTDPLVMRCQIEVTQSGEWQVQLSDEDGRQNEIAVSLRLNALANKEPVLQLTTGGDAVVSALEEFEVAVKIKDDYAVTSAGIGYQLAGGELIERPLEIKPASEKNKKESTVADMIDFESLNAQPEQLLSYYLFAEDMDEQGEPRRITSDIYFVEIRPFEEIFRQGDPSAEQQQQQNQQNQDPQQGGEGEELLELQKQIISATWNIARSASSKGLPQRAAEDLEVVVDSQKQALQMLQEQAAEAPPESAVAIRDAELAMSQAAERLENAARSLSKSDLAQAISAEQQAYQSLLKLQTRENQVSRRQRSQSSSQQSRRQQSRQQQLDQLELEEREDRYQDERRAQEEEKSPESETRQIASRLRELAMRQQDLNQQLRDVEAALQAAETEQQREELEQRLERLRQQQQQILEDTDELQQRMQENQTPEMQEAQQQLEQTRENLQQANQSLRENKTGQALAAGARAQEELEQLREEVREQAANQFGESMQEMRSSAEQLQQRQQQLVEQLKPQGEQPSKGLRDPQQGPKEQAAELTKEQQQELSELLQRMKKTIEQAEDSEPLLAQKLFDGYRRTQEERLEDQLELTKRLVEREFNQDAGELASGTLEDLKTLGKEIGEAAESVLGSDLESMRLALDQLDAARQQVESEIAREAGSPKDDRASEMSQGREGNSERQNTQADSNGSNGQQQSPEGNEQRDHQQGQQPGQQGQQQDEQEIKGQPRLQQDQQQGQQPGQQGQQEGERGQQGQQQGQRSGQSQQQIGQPGLRSGEYRETGELPDDQTRPGLLGGGGVDRNFSNASPITGEDFRNWSDRLRDVEELVTDPELRWEATRIRQAARELRTDWQRTSQPPRWSDVEDLVASPLRDLQRKVSQELMRRAAEKTDIVPVDRDPVPAQYQNLVREYYERLGKGK